MSHQEARERRLEVGRSARYYELGPGGERPPAPGREPVVDGTRVGKELWICCHGHRQLAGRFIRSLAPLDDGRRRIIAPEALNRFYLDDDGGPHGPDARVGATWMTREDRDAEIHDYIAYLDRVQDDAETGDAHVVALGFSQGAATASRWAALGRSRVHRLVLWAGRLPPDLDLEGAAERLRRLRPIYVAGRDDEYVTSTVLAAEAARLDALGVAYAVVNFDGGHHIEADALRRVAQLITDDSP